MKVNLFVNKKELISKQASNRERERDREREREKYTNASLAYAFMRTFLHWERNKESKTWCHMLAAHACEADWVNGSKDSRRTD